MEFRLLTEKDIPSLLELYVQLDENNTNLTVEESLQVWKTISQNKDIKYFGAVDDAKAHNCYKVILMSAMYRTEAHKFYEKLGFDGGLKKAFDFRIKRKYNHIGFRVVRTAK